jgi:HSP20 family protein
MDFIKIKLVVMSIRAGSELGQAFEDMFRSMNPVFNLSERNWKPQMDIYESHDQILILAEIAGVRKEDLEVEINSRAVRIYGHRQQPQHGEKMSYRLAEIQYGRFERTLYLPAPIDAEKVSAAFPERPAGHHTGQTTSGKDLLHPHFRWISPRSAARIYFLKKNVRTMEKTHDTQ